MRLEKKKRGEVGTSLVAHWLRICLPMQWMQVQFLDGDLRFPHTLGQLNTRAATGEARGPQQRVPKINKCIYFFKEARLKRGSGMPVPSFPVSQSRHGLSGPPLSLESCCRMTSEPLSIRGTLTQLTTSWGGRCAWRPRGSQ